MPYLCHSSGRRHCASLDEGSRKGRQFMIWPEAPVNTADVMHAQRQAHMPIFERC